MNLRQEIDLTTIITTLGFIIAMIVWGIRLEGKVSNNTYTLTAREESYRRLQQERWKSLEYRLDLMDSRINDLEDHDRKPHESWKTSTPDRTAAQ